ncbi:MAG: DUF4127 family protein [Selenomonadaceae bacterium]|nr:DUF4127 family protein [Selenomonadaceae bacterium]
MKKALKILGVALSFIGIFTATPDANAKRKNEPEKILYIPHDNRPIVYDQTVDVIEKAGYKVIIPPKEIMGSRDDLGNPDRLWEWLDKNAKKDIRAAVISSDAMLYGSLVSSRKHYYDKQVILERAELFKEFHNKHKKLPLYVFGSVMRTPRNGVASGYEEPDYYRNYGANIFRYTALIDKLELEGLTPRENKEIVFLQKLIPARAMEDWMNRREKNFEANEKLVDMANEKIFDCLLLGRDDNAPFSQTHLEGRNLANYGAKINRNKYQTIAGIDEIGLILLTRAINDYTNTKPAVFVQYNEGKGAATVPTYSDEMIDTSIDSEFFALGANRVYEANRADFILAVNTNPDGKTYEAPDPNNTIAARQSTYSFVSSVQNYLDSGNSVAVADISFANGSDNALMEQLKNRQILFKLKSYSGWNTATNSTGFALSTGILTKKMTDGDKNQLLLTRYLDDWAYQANIRGTVAARLNWIEGEGYYNLLEDKRYDAAAWCEQLLTNFIRNNLTEVKSSTKVSVDFPWNRMFESQIRFK